MPEFENIEQYESRNKDGKPRISPIAPHSLQAVEYSPGGKNRTPKPRAKARSLPQPEIEPVDIRQMEKEFRAAARKEQGSIFTIIANFWKNFIRWMKKKRRSGKKRPDVRGRGGNDNRRPQKGNRRGGKGGKGGPGPQKQGNRYSDNKPGQGPPRKNRRRSRNNNDGGGNNSNDNRRNDQGDPDNRQQKPRSGPSNHENNQGSKAESAPNPGNTNNNPRNSENSSPNDGGSNSDGQARRNRPRRNRRNRKPPGESNSRDNSQDQSRE
jgi:hypothetical protein